MYIYIYGFRAPFFCSWGKSSCFFRLWSAGSFVWCAPAMLRLPWCRLSMFRGHCSGVGGLSLLARLIGTSPLDIDGYGSIPINTIFSGMNIHLPAILMFTRGPRGTRFWHTARWIIYFVASQAGQVLVWQIELFEVEEEFCHSLLSVHCGYLIRANMTAWAQWEHGWGGGDCIGLFQATWWRLSFSAACDSPMDYWSTNGGFSWSDALLILLALETWGSWTDLLSEVGFA